MKLRDGGLLAGCAVGFVGPPEFRAEAGANCGWDVLIEAPRDTVGLGVVEPPRQSPMVWSVNSHNMPPQS